MSSDTEAIANAAAGAVQRLDRHRSGPIGIRGHQRWRCHQRAAVLLRDEKKLAIAQRANKKDQGESGPHEDCEPAQGFSSQTQLDIIQLQRRSIMRKKRLEDKRLRKAY
jgi:hypothetical protein